MKVKVMKIDGSSSSSEMELPKVFETPFRTDLIKRAVLAEQSEKRQPQGRHPLAGRRVAEASTGPGRGISKVPRTNGKGTHHGSRGTFIHSTRGGKLAFPPKVEKIIVEKINKKEKFFALKAAVSMTASKEHVLRRGHKVSEDTEFPLVVEDEVTDLNKSSEVINFLSSLGFAEDLERTAVKKIRAGKGKRRGRRYRRKTGPLIVVDGDCDLVKAGRNVQGLQIVSVSQLKVEMLAPGTEAGRATVWTMSAMEKLQEWN